MEALPTSSAPFVYVFDYMSPDFNATHPADGLLGWAMIEESNIGKDKLGIKLAGLSAVRTNAHAHACAHARACAHAHTHARAQIHDLHTCRQQLQPV